MADRALLSDFCLALFFTVCIFHFFLVIKTTKKPPSHISQNWFFVSVTRLGSGSQGPCSATCQGTWKKRGQRHEKLLMLKEDPLGRKKAPGLFKTNWLRKSWMERKESFSTRSVQQTLSPKNLLAIHYAGLVVKKFLLSRDIRSTYGRDLTCATEVQSSLLIHPGTWTTQCVFVLSQGGNTSHRKGTKR